MDPLIRTIYYQMLLGSDWAWAQSDLDAFNVYLKVVQKHIKLRHAGLFNGEILSIDEFVGELRDKYGW